MVCILTISETCITSERQVFERWFLDHLQVGAAQRDLITTEDRQQLARRFAIYCCLHHVLFFLYFVDQSGPFDPALANGPAAQWYGLVVRDGDRRKDDPLHFTQALPIGIERFLPADALIAGLGM